MYNVYVGQEEEGLYRNRIGRFVDLANFQVRAFKEEHNLMLFIYLIYQHTKYEVNSIFNVGDLLDQKNNTGQDSVGKMKGIFNEGDRGLC